MEKTSAQPLTIGIVIPTYNREKELETTLDHILKQTHYPDAVAIIDDSSVHESKIKEWELNFKERNIKFIYYKKDHNFERRGLSESKNKAVRLVPTDILLFIDDDIYLEKDAILHIKEISQRKYLDINYAGVAGVITNNRNISKLEKIYNTIFFLSSPKKWDVTKTGFQVWDDHIKKEELGYYSHGGFTAYMRTFLDSRTFPLFSGGRTALEDVYMSAKAKKEGYYFIISPFITAYHDFAQSAREANFLMGEKETQNRKEIFKLIKPKKGFLLSILFMWSLTGWILRQFLVGHFNKGLGMISGIFKTA